MIKKTLLRSALIFIAGAFFSLSAFAGDYPHKPIKLYEVETELEKNDSLNTYHMTYPELSRKLSIKFSINAPFKIYGWVEQDLSSQDQKSIAQINKTIKLPYWKLNKLGDERYRDSLGLN